MKAFKVNSDSHVKFQSDSKVIVTVQESFVYEDGIDSVEFIPETNSSNIPVSLLNVFNNI